MREYPDYTPTNPPQGYVVGPLAPEVVATGTVLPGVTSPALDPQHTGGTTPANGTTFGVIGAWDGHRVGKGRVVVDSTWHHFFDINLSGDRYLEDDSLPANQLQKLRGFYTDDGSGNSVPNAAYRAIRWYFRNIIYWLIPADRGTPIWWKALAQLTVGPQLSEELQRVRIPDGWRDLRLDHYLYFGQLAEDYLAQARGSCATHEVHRYIHRPKIPWWEWVEAIVDIWDPVRAIDEGGPVRREQWLGAVGLSARPELVASLSLGAALVTAAAVTALQATDDEQAIVARDDGGRMMEEVEAAYGEVLVHAATLLGRELRGAGKVAGEVEKLAAELQCGR